MSNNKLYDGMTTMHSTFCEHICFLQCCNSINLLINREQDPFDLEEKGENGGQMVTTGVCLYL